MFSQLNRPMRAGGFALIGVAAIAVVIGTASAVTGDGDDTAEPAAPTDGPQAGDGQQGPDPAPGEQDGDGPDGDQDGESPTATPGQDGDESSDEADGDGNGDADGDGNGDGDGTDEDATSPGSPGGSDRSSAPGSSSGNERVGRSGDDGKQHRSVAVRVYNNSTMSGLAGEVSDDLCAAGWNVVATNNYSGGKIPTTTAYYRPGTAEKAAAEAIARDFDMRIEPRFEGIADASGGVIVIATNDYQGPSGKS